MHDQEPPSPSDPREDAEQLAEAIAEAASRADRDWNAIAAQAHELAELADQVARLPGN